MAGKCDPEQRLLRRPCRRAPSPGHSRPSKEETGEGQRAVLRNPSGGRILFTDQEEVASCRASWPGGGPWACSRTGSGRRCRSSGRGGRRGPRCRGWQRPVGRGRSAPRRPRPGSACRGLEHHFGGPGGPGRPGISAGGGGPAAGCPGVGGRRGAGAGEGLVTSVLPKAGSKDRLLPPLPRVTEGILRGPGELEGSSPLTPRPAEGARGGAHPHPEGDREEREGDGGLGAAAPQEEVSGRRMLPLVGQETESHEPDACPEDWGVPGGGMGRRGEGEKNSARVAGVSLWPLPPSLPQNTPRGGAALSPRGWGGGGHWQLFTSQSIQCFNQLKQNFKNNPTPRLHWPHFKCSAATCGRWLPNRGAQVPSIPTLRESSLGLLGGAGPVTFRGPPRPETLGLGRCRRGAEEAWGLRKRHVHLLNAYCVPGSFYGAGHWLGGWALLGSLHPALGSRVPRYTASLSLSFLLCDMGV